MDCVLHEAQQVREAGLGRQTAYYQNPEVDKLIEAMQTVDAEKRSDLVKQAWKPGRYGLHPPAPDGPLRRRQPHRLRAQVQQGSSTPGTSRLRIDGRRTSSLGLQAPFVKRRYMGNG